MQCPKCGFESADQTTECLKCGIVFAKFVRRTDTVQPKATGLEADSTKDNETKRELIFRLVALPAALLFARFAVALVPGGVRLLTMWVHECGHAVTAWLCGFGATPGPWVTPVSAERHYAVSALVLAGAGFAGYRAWRTQRWLLLALAGAAVLALLRCTRLFSDQAMQLIIFGGDAGCFVLGSVLMMTFYARRESQLYQNSLRWTFLVIGALAFSDAYVIWTGGIQNIPFGENENGLSDPSVLTEMYNWPVQLLIRRYVDLAHVCLAALAVFYVAGLSTAALQLSASRGRIRATHRYWKYRICRYDTIPTLMC